MPSLAAPLKKWIAQCKAYAAKNGCSYKEAMTALKKSRRASHHGGGVADNAASVGSREGFEGQHTGTPPPTHASAPPAHAGTPPPPAGTPPPPDGQHGGQAMFETGAPQAGGRRRRRSSGYSKRKRSQQQTGGKRRSRSNSRGRGRGRRQTKRGGSALSYSMY